MLQQKLSEKAAPSLRDLQRWMRWIVADPRGVLPALADLQPTHEAALLHPDRYREPTVRHLSSIVETPPLGREQRLEIYAEAYFSRLLESLSADFPALRAVMGEDGFKKLCADFLKAHPSRTYNIGEVGEPLARFLLSYPLSEQVPWLPELAALEWALIEAFYADDQAQLDPEGLSRIAPQAWAKVRFELAKSVKLLEPRFEVERLWAALGDETLLEQEASELDESERGTGVMLLRDEQGHVEVLRLDRAPFQVLSAMSRGECLTEICERLEVGEDGASPPLMQWFSTWVACGAISRIQVT